MAKLQISIRALLLFVAGVAILMAAAIEVNGRIEDLAANGYRVQAAGDLLVEYLDDCGTWPKNWDDLHHYVDSHETAAIQTVCEQKIAAKCSVGRVDLRRLNSSHSLNLGVRPWRIDGVS